MSSSQPPESTQEEILVLRHASQVGRTDIVNHAILSLRKLLTGGEEELVATISSGLGSDQSSPLHIAASNGHADVIRALLNANANPLVIPDEGDLTGKTPYQAATETAKQAFHVYLFEQIAMGKNEKIHSLIESGIPANVGDGSKADDGPLHWAVSFANREAASMLIKEFFVDVDTVNKEGQSTLHLAVKAANKDIIELLITEGIDQDIVDSKGKKAIDICPASKSEDIKAFMASIVPDPNSRKASSLSCNQTDTAERSGSTSEGDGSQIGVADDDFELAHVDEDSQTVLVLWPPAQRQVRRGGDSADSHLLISSDEILYICVASDDIDIFPLLTWSGLIDVFDKYNLNAQAKKSFTGAKMTLCIDQNICPGRHRFELSVCPSSGIQIFASDATALLYAAYSLIQLITLHSEVDISNGVTTLKIPNLLLQDFPDVPNRGILWSYRKHARYSTPQIRRLIEQISKLRINQLHLVVDCQKAEEGESSTSSSSSSSSSSNPSAVPPLSESELSPSSSSSSSSAVNFSPAKIYAIDEVCRRHCVELIPTLIITDPNQRVSIEGLRSFSRRTVTLILLFQGTNSDDKAYDERCQEACRSLFTSILAAGNRSITLANGPYTRQSKDILPSKIALQLGLLVKEAPLDQFLNPELYDKPVVTAQALVKAIEVSSQRAFERASSTTVFPAYMESEFFQPLLLTKYYIYLFGGFSWNRAGICEMLGESYLSSEDSRLSLLRETVCLSVLGHNDMDCLSQVENTVLDLLTDTTLLYPTANSTVDGNGNNSSTNSVLAQAESESTARHSSSPELLRNAERKIWGIITCSASELSSGATAAVPGKQHMSELLKAIRRILSVVPWKLNESARMVSTNRHTEQTSGASQDRTDWSLGAADSSSDRNGAKSSRLKESFEIVELISVLHVMQVLTRAIILAYNAGEKAHGTKWPPLTDGIPFLELIRAVPSGTKSDVANSFLEAIGSSSSIWVQKFEHIRYRSNANAISANLSVERLLRKRYLREFFPNAPLSAVMRAIGDGLPALSMDQLMENFYKNK